MSYDNGGLDSSKHVFEKFSPYLNIDPHEIEKQRHLNKDSSIVISPEGPSIFEQLSSTIGKTFLISGSFGVCWGLADGLYYKKTNPSVMRHIFQSCVRKGHFVSDHVTSAALIYFSLNMFMESVRDRQDALNPLVSGAITGLCVKWKGPIAARFLGTIIGSFSGALYGFYRYGAPNDIFSNRRRLRTTLF